MGFAKPIKRIAIFSSKEQCVVIKCAHMEDEKSGKEKKKINKDDSGCNDWHNASITRCIDNAFLSVDNRFV